MRNKAESSNFAAIKTPISQKALGQLFYEARTHSTSLPEPVPVELLREAYELARLGPTSADGSPARFVFLTTHIWAHARAVSGNDGYVFKTRRL